MSALVESVADDQERPPTDSGTNSKSCLYTGTVQHRRFSPARHNFTYRLFLVCLNLDELDSIFRFPFLCSTGRFSVMRFKRSDYFGDHQKPLDACVRELVEERIGIKPTGPIQLLTHLRFFGFSFNPVSFYYCFDSSGESLQAVVAEVTNTPWGERHCYVIPCSDGQSVHRFECRKEFHVSPFMPMSMCYRWRLKHTAGVLSVLIENFDDARFVVKIG